MKNVRNSILFIIALVASVSCTKDNEVDVNNMQWNIVTFIEENSGNSIFKYQSYNDSPEQTLIAKNQVGLKMKKGERSMLYYNLTSQKESTQEISIYSKISTIFDSLRITSHENVVNYESNPARLKSIWRTGNFININTYLQYTGEPRQLVLVMDQSTRYDEVVDCYLIDNIMGAEGLFYRRAYISFFIGNVWQQSSCKTLRVHLNDESFPNVKYYDFSK